MVVVDHGLSKGVIITPCNKNITAEGCAQIFFNKVFTRYGMYDSIISDRGPQFASRFAKEMARILGYQIKLSTAYRPQSDGQTERYNQTIETYLRIYCHNNPGDWENHINLAEFAHNN
jgi:transposase InsO family protein